MRKSRMNVGLYKIMFIEFRENRTKLIFTTSLVNEGRTYDDVICHNLDVNEPIILSASREVAVFDVTIK